MSSKMKDGEGALYFVRPKSDDSELRKSVARHLRGSAYLIKRGWLDPLHFVPDQATKKTRQQLREDSPSGLVSMPSYLGKSRFVAFICKVLRRA